MRHVHVIPVPSGMDPIEAWSEIVIMGRLIDPGEASGWATIACDGRECGDVDRTP